MRRAHHAASLPAPVPVSVPLLVLDVHEDNTLTATLDGRLIEPPAGTRAWRRASFPEIMDHATQARAFPVRVTVHENDGTTFTDILPAAAPVRQAPEPGAEPEAGRAVKRRRGVDPVEVDGGDGFIAGEDVAVALITAHTDASHDGRVRTLFDPAVIAATRAREVVLVGRVSGTIAVRSLP